MIIRDQLRFKVKDVTKPKKKRMILEVISGSERSANGKWVNKERTIDKNNDQYTEVITDENGIVIHSCNEPLSVHQGHGNAKFKAGINRKQKS
jgi:hypothetical protein